MMSRIEASVIPGQRSPHCKHNPSQSASIYHLPILAAQSARRCLNLAKRSLQFHATLLGSSFTITCAVQAGTPSVADLEIATYFLLKNGDDT